MPGLIERHAAVGGDFTREAQNPFADDVARHLRGPAAERGCLPGQVTLADVE